MDIDRDFQYVLQDFSNVYIGARLTYRQLTQQEDTPQRLSSAIFQYVYKEGLEDVRICDHLMSIQEETAPCLIYTQLKAQVKIIQPVAKTDRKGQETVEYKQQTYPVADFVHNKALREQVQPEQITEVTFKKLHLMSLHV